MERLEAAGICLFCPDSLREHAEQRVIFSTEHWAVTPNAFPYPGTRLHLLVGPRRHVNDMLDLDEASLGDFWAALRRIRERYGLGHDRLGGRDGTRIFTRAAIAHVHPAGPVSAP